MSCIPLPAALVRDRSSRSSIAIAEEVSRFLDNATVFRFPKSPPYGWQSEANEAHLHPWMTAVDIWRKPRHDYYACELGEPSRQTAPTFWRKLRGDVEYDEHPGVPKDFINK
ncbi:hypothetical protein M422DRAFT_272985 [Sphaerobolus stellatus SS14]|uniref:Uncharacterized protein n=1 Tax=Sphaerobolus stellatus (strain SS14) TaxID=990650 RepID=A0A0C9TAA0_SPHS4|nr:hypothetical protein M422DRAFT_272985 [Sphaerobolus stellatus SS14]